MTSLPPFAARSETSRRGAIAAYHRAPTQSQRILAFLNGRPATRREIAEALGMELGTVCARVKPLLDKGDLIVCGKKPGAYGTENELLTGVLKQGGLFESGNREAPATDRGSQSAPYEGGN